MIITKRNGTREKFQIEKIIKAVNSAFQSEGKQMPEYLIGLIRSLFSQLEGELNVEDVQNKVEELLMNEKLFKVAKSYILYRESHKQARFIKNRIDYMNKYSSGDSNAATASETDANANVTMKNIANLEGEVYKTTNRIIQRQRMKDKLNELFPEVAKQYERDLASNIIYAHDESQTPALKNYCMACTLYPLMLEGTGNIDGVTPSPPNDIQSFSGQVTNLLFLLSSQVRGAVALGDYIVVLNYYVIKEFGEKWYNKLDSIVTSEHCNKSKTILGAIRKGMKQFIYGINQPAGNRNYNSPFSNLNFFDKYYFKALFKDFYYPDGTQPEWEAIDTLQRTFVILLRELRLQKPLTFPVTSFCVLHDNNDLLDQEYKDFIAEEWSKGSSFFLYLSNNPDSISSCCFSKDTKFLWKSSTSGVRLTTFEEYYKLPYTNVKENFKVFHNGSWVKGKVVKLPNRPMYKVTTYNNKEFIMTDNHINVTLHGEKTTTSLTTDDYLLFNTLRTNPTPENDEHLTYAQGFVVGAFLGDGSFSSEIKGTIYDTILSQNEIKKVECIKYLKQALTDLEDDSEITQRVIGNKHDIHISSKKLVQFIQYWTNWYRGTYSYNKSLNLNCLLQSIEFRKGILDGWYNTDGGNSNRCYTTSKELAENMEALITSLGMQSIINISNRTDEKVIIRGEEFNRNYPLYCVRWYEQANHRNNKDVENSWVKINNGVYFKIKAIEPIEYSDEVYCIECENKKEPYFTLPSGLITHNCRVQNEITDNTFNSTIGLTGIMTGSTNVITLNLNRIIQDWAREYSKDGLDYADLHTFYAPESGFKNYLVDILERIYKYQIAYKSMIYDMEDAGMYSSSNAGYIFTKKLYCTIGVIGYCEAAQFLGLEITNNSEYKRFLKFIFNVIQEENRKHSIHDKKRPFIFNTEAIPGENLAVKLYEKDKSDGYYVPEDQNLYSSYFFKQWDGNISILDKLKLHGKEINQYCGGGQACHLHLEEHPTKEQFIKLIDFTVKEGVNYWTVNVPMSECKDCGYVVNAPIKECPKCKGKNIDWWVRIIGYLRPISSYSMARQIEADKRVYNKV